MLCLKYKNLTFRLLCSICPYVILLGSFIPNLHYLIFGILAFSTGGLVLWTLPETNGRPLPQDIEDLMEML